MLVKQIEQNVAVSRFDHQGYFEVQITLYDVPSLIESDVPDRPSVLEHDFNTAEYLGLNHNRPTAADGTKAPT